VRRKARHEKETALHSRSELVTRPIERNRRTRIRAEWPRGRTDAIDLGDALGIDAREHVHVLENRVQLANESLRALVAEPEPGEGRDVPNIIDRNGH
jgi:hypothetical protein